jgi:hypothetical protein
MDDYFGFILFAWIVIAPTLGLVFLGRFDRHRPARSAFDGAHPSRTRVE